MDKQLKGEFKNVAELIGCGVLLDIAPADIVTEIKKRFPESTSGPKDVAWYKMKLKQQGFIDETGHSVLH